MVNIAIFEDERVDQLVPITLSRPAYSISCASYRLIDWISLIGQPTMGVVRPHLRSVQEVYFSSLCSTQPTPQAPWLIVNARLVPSRTTFQTLQSLINHATNRVVWHDGQVAAAYVPYDLIQLDQPGHALTQAHLANALQSFPAHDAALPLFGYPHDVVRHNLLSFGENLEHRISQGGLQEIADGVFVAAGAKLGEHVVVDTKDGPVVLDENAQIGPYCYLSGPAYLGVQSRVIEHSAIKDAVSIGHTTKIGGEVEASIIEPYSNKQHHGFLGHSYLGSWINLGAGTCNSDLKNTYGEVKMEYQGQKVATGMQFVGCIMGDYAKSAINTGIFTGKTIGTCSMVYGFVTTNVPSFVNYARSFGQVTELPPQVMIATQKRMFKRREVTQKPCDVQLLHDMYELTRGERQLAGDPLSL